jgi:hypothetical protein
VLADALSQWDSEPMRGSTSFARIALALAGAAIVTLPGTAVASPAPVAATTGRFEHVSIRRVNTDGTVSVRMYTFVAGSAAVRSFTAPPGWVRHGRSASATSAAVCRYGDTLGLGDNTLIYPCVRWGHAGFSDPQVYFRDHTPAAWPVREAVADWNQTVGIDSYWIWNTTACPAASTGKHCVNVYAGAYGTDDLSAWIDYQYDDRSNRFIDGTVKVYFNTSYNHGNANQHRSTACEEIGHALGVGHNTDETEGSCMNQMVGPVPVSDLHPGSNDRGLLTHVVYPD